jgi:ATP-dependent Clp protease ATP-binding subunit ClpC
MFEHFTEKARRVIFFARYEASPYGSPFIETEQLLLGILREDKGLTNRVLGSHSVAESIRKQIDGLTEKREKISTSIDLPLSTECKRAFAFAAEESQRMQSLHLETDHLLGLLREENSLAAQLLREHGVAADQLRDKSRKAFWIPEEP